MSQQPKVPVPRQPRTATPGFTCTKCGGEVMATEMSFDPRFGWSPCPTCHRRTICIRGAVTTDRPGSAQATV